MTEFIYELMIMIVVTLLVFAIVALRDRISIQRYYNTFQITPSIKIFYERGWYAELDLAWLKWHVSITLYLKEYDATLEDGLDDETPLSELEFETTTDEPVAEQQFRGTAVPTVPFQGSHRVTLTMNRAETAPITFTPEMLREIKQQEDTMWGRDNDESR
jgi:hypothetical protein